MSDNTYDANASPRLYVGTYAAYNAGSLRGAWLDLEDFDGPEAFYEKARELHAGEPDPEFMFQDFEGFPRAFYHESSIPTALWDWIEADEHDRRMWAAWLDATSEESADLDTIRNAFAGEYDSEADWSESFLEDTGALQTVPENLRNYIDFEAYARDARLGGDVIFHRFDGDLFVFWNH